MYLKRHVDILYIEKLIENAYIFTKSKDHDIENSKIISIDNRVIK